MTPPQGGPYASRDPQAAPPASSTTVDAVSERRRRNRRVFERYALTAGELGASTGQTALIALLPILLREHTSSTFWIGLALACEGVLALTVPFAVGLASDRLPAAVARRFGRRTFFLMMAAPVMAGALVVIPFLRSYWTLVAAAFVFFAGLHAYQTPLWALMIDAVPSQSRSRVQGVRGLLRSGGLALGLVGGGLLHDSSASLPFVSAAGLIMVTTVLTVIAGRAAPARPAEPRQRGAVRRLLGELRGNRRALWFIVANACWSGAIDGVRPYFFLFAVTVLGISVGQASLGLMVLVGGLGVGAVLIGHLGDRFSRLHLLQAGVVAVFVALGAGFFARDVTVMLVIVPFAGAGAAAIVALAYPAFADLVGRKSIGQYTGLYIFSVGFGRILAPLAVGAVLDAGKRVLPDERGYPFMWLVAAALAGAAFVALGRAARTPRSTAPGHVSASRPEQVPS